MYKLIHVCVFFILNMCQKEIVLSVSTSENILELCFAIGWSTFHKQGIFSA